MRRPITRAAKLVLWLLLAFVVVIVGEAVVTARREYLVTPEYDVRGSLEPRGKPASAQPLRLVMLGDSTVAGLGADRVDQSLVLQTSQRVADRLGRTVHAHGLGISGARTADVENEQIPMVDPNVDVVVIVIGSNDVTHLTPAWRFDEATAAMLNAARRRAPGAAIVLGGIPLFGEARALDEPLRSVVDAYASVLRNAQRKGAARSDAAYVDIARLASPRFVGVAGAMSSDNFHPGAIGYGFWSDALAPAVAAAVEG